MGEGFGPSSHKFWSKKKKGSELVPKMLGAGGRKAKTGICNLT